MSTESVRRKSSYSNGGGGNCVAAGVANGRPYVEDTKQDGLPQGKRDRVTFTRESWAAFVARVRG